VEVLLFLLISLFILALVIGSLALWVWALVDCIQVPADAFFRNGNKVLWAILIGVLGLPAAVIYFLIGRPDKSTRDWIKAQKRAGVNLSYYPAQVQPLQGQSFQGQSFPGQPFPGQQVTYDPAAGFGRPQPGEQWQPGEQGPSGW
jgi:type VI protein secretion system component VasK